MDEEDARMMKRWRNILCPMTPPELVDKEIRRINRAEKALGLIPEEADRIRGLISRVDPLCYCHIFNNIDFIINAVGALSYPGSPSIDVLERCVLRGGQLPSDVKERAEEYIYSLDSWLDARPPSEALVEKPQYAKTVQRVHHTLGERSPYKEWLVTSLVKTLKEHAYSPLDWLSQFSSTEALDQAYRIALGRAATPEEAESTLRALKEGKSPAAVVCDLIGSEEYRAKNLPSGIWETASDEDSVAQVYGLLLGREPSPDDLGFRLNEIHRTGSRDAVVESVLRSREHVERQLRRVAEALKSS